MSCFEDLTKEILLFRDARDWKQFHTPKNLAASLAIEAGELLECFQWKSDGEIEESRETLKTKAGEELADVFIYTLLLAKELNIDLHSTTKAKIKKNAEKYPSNLAYGNAKKYTEYEK